MQSVSGKALTDTHKQESVCVSVCLRSHLEIAVFSALHLCKWDGWSTQSLQSALPPHEDGDTNDFHGDGGTREVGVER